MFQPRIDGLIMCIIIGDAHQLIGHCLIPLDPWKYFFLVAKLLFNSKCKYVCEKVLSGIARHLDFCQEAAYSAIINDVMQYRLPNLIDQM